MDFRKLPSRCLWRSAKPLMWPYGVQTQSPVEASHGYDPQPTGSPSQKLAVSQKPGVVPSLLQNPLAHWLLSVHVAQIAPGLPPVVPVVEPVVVPPLIRPLQRLAQGLAQTEPWHSHEASERKRLAPFGYSLTQDWAQLASLQPWAQERTSKQSVLFSQALPWVEQAPLNALTSQL